jgi:predicted nucleotidyltransferase
MIGGIRSDAIKATGPGKGSCRETPCTNLVSVQNRLELAKVVTANLRRREGRNLVAVGVFGSVGRREERRHSDVDLLVVVRRKRRGIQHTIQDGILVTVLQETPAEARDEVMGSRPGMNDALGGWRSMRPLFDPSGLLRRLRSRAYRPTPRQAQGAARLHFLETYEDLGKLWNAIEAGDAEEAREVAIWFSGAAMGTLFDMESHILKTGRRAFVDIRRYGKLGAAIRRLRYDALSISETQSLSEFVWTELLDRAAAKGLRLPPLPRDARGSL